MAEPTSKVTRSRRGKRRSHGRIKKVPTLGKCPSTHELHLAHKAIRASDGAIYYKGRQLTPANDV